jgi:hypothetical protein
VARSIRDWYDDHADGGDSNRDDEFVERHAVWDVPDSYSPAAHSSTDGRLDAKSQHGTRPGAVTPMQVGVRSEVLAMRRLNRAASFKEIAGLLRAKGIHVTRADVAAIVNHPTVRPTPTPRRARAVPAHVDPTSTAALPNHSGSTASRRTRKLPKQTSARNRQLALQRERAAAEARRRTTPSQQLVVSPVSPSGVRSRRSGR